MPEPTKRLQALVAQCESEVAAVRALIASPPDGDAVREAYGELVDRYRDVPECLALVKPLGDEIRRLEAEGALPSTLVARTDRRKK